MESIWGSFGVVKATLNAITEIVKDNRHGYTILISGQCYPIKSNEYIYSFLAKNYGYNFIEGFELPDPRWSSSIKRMRYYAFFMSTKKEDFVTVPSFLDLSFKAFFQLGTIKRYFKIILTSPLKSLVLFKKRRFPIELKPYGGTQWWALPLETLKFIDGFIAENPGYLKYHLFTLFSDEIFFQTLVHNYFDKVKPPITFASWPNDDSAPSPETLTADDLIILKEKKELFARKFDYKVDTKIMDLIDSELLQIE
jgi:hypothetical protein